MALVETQSDHLEVVVSEEVRNPCNVPENLKPTPFTCLKCERSFQTMRGLMKHQVSHPEAASAHNHRSLGGKRIASSRNLEEHKAIHTGLKKYCCAQCGNSYGYVRNLKRHMDTHKVQAPFSCPKCERHFTGPQELKKHQCRHSRGIPRPCIRCGKKCRNYSSLKVHQRSSKCQGVEQRNSGSICGKVSTSTLKRHKAIHSAEKPYSCTPCGKGFTLLRNLKRHEKHFHAGEKPNLCSQCGKGFKVVQHLQDHMATHSGRRPHQRSRPDEQFTDDSSLRSPLSVETKFNCTQCAASFGLSEDLERHKRFHAGEKPCHCNYCGKSFTLLKDLRKHVRTHAGDNPFNCGQCGKGFSLANDLLRHERCHTGERPYSCIQCKKAYKRSHHLKAHYGIEHGGLPFSCVQCEEKFLTERSLKKHQKRHKSGNFIRGNGEWKTGKKRKMDSKNQWKEQKLLAVKDERDGECTERNANHTMSAKEVKRRGDNVLFFDIEVTV